MCDFCSVIVRRDGLIYHDPSNSHSQMAQKAGWKENGVGTATFIELEWDGVGKVPKWEGLAKSHVKDWTKAQQDSGEAFYLKVSEWLSGDGSHKEFFSRPENADIYWRRYGGRVEISDDGSIRYLDLNGLKTAEGLVLPEKIGGYLDLRGLTTAEGLVLPKEIGGYLNLRGLTTAEGLVLPEKIGGTLDLRGLTTAEGLVLPEKIGGYLYLNGLTTAEGLVLPKEIGGYLYISSDVEVYYR